MAEFFAEYALFLAKAVTVVVAILLAVGGIVALASRRHPEAREHLEIKHLNREYERMARSLQAGMLSKRELRHILKRWKRERKQAAGTERKKIFVLNFHGDILASAVASLRQEVTAILTVARPEDEVVVRLESAGGVVHGYGLAASQLARFKERQIAVTVAVDKIAASGGYMMACVADRIIAAPFAVLGSIGVIAQLPNFHRLLKKNDIDFEQFTAGEFKRTITLFGENTERARAKFREEIEGIHALFKDFVKRHRPAIDIESVATGEHWYGPRALELKLADELRTSDDYLLEASEQAELYEVAYRTKKGLIARLFRSPVREWGWRLPPWGGWG